MKATAMAVDPGSVEVDSLRYRYSAAGPKRTRGRKLTAEPESHGDVLDGVSLTVPAGRTLALLGPSGCGKTTLLRSIAGLERPSAGLVSIDGEPMSGGSAWIPAERRKIGMVFQDWALFPHMSVAKNVAYGLGRQERTEREQIVETGLALVGLHGLGDRMPSTLSGGQQQRVALARALAPKPRVLLLDEPFSNLDTSLRAEVRAEVHNLLLDLGITAIFVTHDQEEAFVLGDQVAVMNSGRIEQIDTPHEIYTAPASRWVAQFVGEASLVSGRANGWQVATALGDLTLESPHDGTVDVLVRPEQLSLGQTGESAIVDSVEFYGHDAMVYVMLDGQRVRVRTAPEIKVRRGDKVNVTFAGHSVRAFAAD